MASPSDSTPTDTDSDSVPPSGDSISWDQHPYPLLQWCPTFLRKGAEHLLRFLVPVALLRYRHSFTAMALTTVSVLSLSAAWSHWGPLDSNLERELFFWWISLGLLWCFGWGTMVYTSPQSHPQSTPSLKGLWGWGILVITLAACVYPVHSSDIWGYINRGWQQVAYETNPYVTPIADIENWRSDPMFTKHWENNPCPYGVLFAQTASNVALWTQSLGGTKAIAVGLFKGLNVLWVLAMGLAIQTLQHVWMRSGMLPSTTTDPVRTTNLGLFLWFWHPLLLIQTLMNGHNDIWMGALSVLAVVSVTVGAAYTLIPALVLGGLTKVAASVSVPFAALWLWQNNFRKDLILGIILAGLLIWQLVTPYLSPDLQWSHLFQNASIFHSSLGALFWIAFKLMAQLIPPLEPWLPELKQALKSCLYGSYGLFLILLTNSLFRQHHHSTATSPTTSPLVKLIVLIVLPQWVLIGLVSPKFYPWYGIMVLPLALLLPPGHGVKTIMVGWCTLLTLGITFLGQAHWINGFLFIVLPALWSWWMLIDHPGPSNPSNSPSPCHHHSS